MSGYEFKLKLERCGWSPGLLAVHLGWSSQRLYSVLRSSDLKSGFIENVAIIVGRPVSWFYGEPDYRSVAVSLAESVRRCCDDAFSGLE